MSSRYTELTGQLRSLKLSTMAESFSDVALKAVRNSLSHEAYLHELVRLECEAREQRRRARLLSESGLPRVHFRPSFGSRSSGYAVARLCSRPSTWWWSASQGPGRAIFWPVLATPWWSKAMLSYGAQPPS